MAIPDPVDLGWESVLALRAIALELTREEGVSEALTRAADAFTVAYSATTSTETHETNHSVTRCFAAYLDVIIGDLDRRLNWLVNRVSEDTPAELEADLDHVKSLLDRARGAEPLDSWVVELFVQLKARIAFLCANLLPDLALEPFEIPNGPGWLSPYPPEAEKPATVSVLVKNIGLCDVDMPFETELSVDSKLVNTWTFNPNAEGMEKPPTPLRPGRSVLYAYQLTLSPGLHTIRWVVDTKDQIQESDETDKSNRLELQETWYATDDLPDPAVVDIWHEGPLLLGLGQIWKVRLTNLGRTPAAGDISVALKNGDGVQFGFFTLGYLGAGQSVVLEAQANPSWKPVQETITAEIYNANAELDKGNNRLTKTFDVSYVDLELKDISVTPRGGMTVFDITVANNGPADAPFSFKVKLQAPDMQDVLLDCPSIPAGGSTQVHHIAPHPIGDGQVRAEADYPDVGLWADVPKPPDPTRMYWEQNLDNNWKLLEYRARRVVLIIVDGLRPDKFEAYLNNELVMAKYSGLRELGLGGQDPSHTVQVLNARTVFPSTTLTANASLVTGAYPCKHGIAATSYYKADKKQAVNWGDKDLGPTIYGFYDKFIPPQNWAAVLNGWQLASAGCGGLDKELAESGTRTIYDVLCDYHFASHVFYHHYSKGSGYDLPYIPAGFAEQLDGWDPPIKDDLICLPTISGNDDISFFEHFDARCAAKAKWWIENLPLKVPFPRLLTLYFASIDHACHVRGLYDQAGNTAIDFQRKYLLRIDQDLYQVIQAFKTRFPKEFENTIFVIVADHGHDTVDRWNKIDHHWLFYRMTPPAGPFGVGLQKVYGDVYGTPLWLKIQEDVGVFFEGTSAQVYATFLHRPNVDAAAREAVIKDLLGNLCYTDGQLISTVIARLPSDPVYREYHVEQDKSGWVLKGKPLTGPLALVQMLNNTNRSGDIILLANRQNLYQFTDTLPHATSLSIPLTSIQNMRIPFSEVFNTASTHGGVDTMDIPLMFVGRPFEQDYKLQEANIVDVAPTILAMLGLSSSPTMDGEPLLDGSLKPTAYMGSLISLGLELLDSPMASTEWFANFEFITDTRFRKSARRARRRSVTVKTTAVGPEAIGDAVLVIDPDSERQREIRPTSVEGEILTFTFDARSISEGTHQAVVEGVTIGGTKARSRPAEFITDTVPPSVARIDSVVRVDSREAGTSKESAWIQVNATVVDDVGISLVELHDGRPDADTLIGSTQRIENSKCTVRGILEPIGGVHHLFIRAYDHAGNYRVGRATMRL